jgi:pyruvate dehydrogenase E1 component beta subunit
MVTSPHVPTPFNPALEDAYAPSAERIVAAVRDTLGRPTNPKMAEQEQTS